MPITRDTVQVPLRTQIRVVSDEFDLPQSLLMTHVCMDASLDKVVAYFQPFLPNYHAHAP